MRNRKVYLVMCHHVPHKETYVSGACTTKKKAEEYKKYISKIMEEHDPDNPRNYWIFDMRVS